MAAAPLARAGCAPLVTINMSAVTNNATTPNPIRRLRTWRELRSFRSRIGKAPLSCWKISDLLKRTRTWERWVGEFLGRGEANRFTRLTPHQSGGGSVKPGLQDGDNFLITGALL